MTELLQSSQALAWSAGVLAAAILLGLAAHLALFWVLVRVADRTGSEVGKGLIESCRKAGRLILPLLIVSFVLPALDLTPQAFRILRHALGLALIGGVAWLVIRLIYGLTDLVVAREPADVTDTLRARRILTRTRILRRVVVAIVAIVAVALMLLTFESVRAVGASILASAGLAGLVVGMAARPVISNLLAGIQIAITEPIRLDDIVFVDGEYGQIEEITLTYAIIRTWDLRRLMVPISYFVERSFQNWTRVSADLLASATIEVEYGVPLDALREELLRILQDSEYWDRRTWGVQATEAAGGKLKVRVMMSVPDHQTAWELRSEVLEKLTAFLQQNQPGESLSAARAAPGDRKR
jgi:small-conductance mechanosensitive channel